MSSTLAAKNLPESPIPYTQSCSVKQGLLCCLINRAAAAEVRLCVQGTGHASHTSSNAVKQTQFFCTIRFDRNSIWIVGHSDGAALAQLAALRLARNAKYGRARIGGVFLFGPQRVGSTAFARLYDGLLGHRTIRWGRQGKGNSIVCVVGVLLQCLRKPTPSVSNLSGVPPHRCADHAALVRLASSCCCSCTPCDLTAERALTNIVAHLLCGCCCCCC
jgi:hypothetical protein